MKAQIHLSSIVAVVALSLLLPACQEKGPAQQAGETIDQATEEAKETVEETVDQEGPAEKAGEEIDELIEEAGEKTDELKDEAEEAVK
ncbi:MAG: hypothetical protein SCH98_14750 [Deferrisomatales bacterium]|nr:hypothetical protein [Deferrisomatales bacterium]